MIYPRSVYPFLCFLYLKRPSLRLLPLHPKKLLNLPKHTSQSMFGRTLVHLDVNRYNKENEIQWSFKFGKYWIK